MNSIIKSNIAIWNVGACFIGVFSSFVCIQTLMSVSKICDVAYSSYAKSKCMDGLEGYYALYISILVIATVAIIAGIGHARRTADGSNQKTAGGFISTIAMILLHGYFLVATIITMAEKASVTAGISSLSASISFSLSSLFGADSSLWIVLLFAVMNLGLAIAGLVFVCIYKPAKAGIETMQEISAVKTGASVVEQFAKPEKKELPPMLNGDDSSTAAAGPAISGLRSMAPIADTASEQPKVAENAIRPQSEASTEVHV